MKTWRKAARTLLVGLTAILAIPALAFAQYRITSFSISPSSAVGLSSQQYTESATISRDPGYENTNVVVRCSCQVNSCGADISIGYGQTSGQASFSPPVLSADSSDTVVAKIYDYFGNLLDSKSFPISILANKPTGSFPNTAVISNGSVSGTVRLRAALPTGQGTVIDFSSNGPVSGGPWRVDYGGQSVSDQLYASTVSVPTTATVTPYVYTGYVQIPGDPITFTVFPAGEPTLPCTNGPGSCEASVAHPINVVNGNVWIMQRDYSLSGLGGGLTIERTWNSLWIGNNGSLPVSGMFGNSWRSTYEEQLASISSSSIQYYRSNGDGWWFQWNSAAQNYQVTSPPNQHATLVYDGTAMLYTITFADGSKRLFNSSGYLTQLVDRNNNQTTITYDTSNRITQVTDAASRAVTLTYGNPSFSTLVTSAQDAVGTIATYSYDTSGRLSSVTYPDNSQFNFAYDGNSLLTSVTDAQGKLVESHTYDSSRRGLTSQRANGVDSVTVSYPAFGTATVTDSFANATTYTYGYTGPAKAVTSVSGPTCASCGAQTSGSFAYDQAGNRTSNTDADGNVTNYAYDTNGNVISKSVPLADGTTPTWTYTYNSFGQVLTATDPLNHSTTNVYDAKGNLLSTTTPSPDGTTPGSTTTFTYNSNGTLKTITDPLGNVTTITYYVTGLVNTIKDANLKVTTYTYDGRGNRLTTQDPVNGSTKLTTFTYDSRNRLTSITYPGATTSVQFHYDYRGRRDYVIDQNGNKTTYAYDNADRLISVTDAQSPTPGVTRYAYDTESNLTSITDANLHQTVFHYNSNRWVDHIDFPANGMHEYYTYDLVGNLKTKTDRNSHTTTYTYDQLNRLTQKSYPTVDYTYDSASRVTQVTDSTGTYTFAYDNMGRLTSAATNYAFTTSGNKTVQYAYDAASNRISMTDPQNLPTTYGYDSLNRLTSLIFNNQMPGFTFGYDGLSRRTSLTRPNGVNTTYRYDPPSHLLSVLHQLGTTTVDGATYTYDNVGNRLTLTNSLNLTTTSFSYDSIYRLTQAAVTQPPLPPVTTETYSYDAVGNRLTSLGGLSYSYNSSNELTSKPGASYTYDNNGNTLTSVTAAATTSYSWDSENRLTSVTLPGAGGTVNFKYDPFGRRAQKSFTQGSTTTTTNYLYDGPNLLEEVDSSGNVVARYTQTRGVDEQLSELRAGTTSYYEADGLGTVTSMTDSSGALAKTYSYDSYGKVTASTGTLTNPFQYTGREFDAESGIYYYRARYYDAQTGRFISEDQLRFGGDGANFYPYVNNNPIIGYDPFGLRTKCMLAGPDGSRSLVCWDDGKGRQRPDGDDFVQFLGRPNNPPNNQSQNAAAIANDFAAFSDCANHIGKKCDLPASPKGGNPFSPPTGPKGDMGVTPNEGTIPIPQFNDPLTHNCDCLKRHPLAALDSRFQFEPGNQNYGISPGCMISIP